MAPSAIAQRRTHNLLLFQKLLNLRDGASPFTMLLDTLEQSSQPVMREFIARAKVSEKEACLLKADAIIFIRNISKTKIIFVSFQTLRKPHDVDVFIVARKKQLGALSQDLSSHLGPPQAPSSRGAQTTKTLLIFDSLNHLSATSPTSLPTFLSTLLSPTSSILAIYHTDIPIPVPSGSASISSPNPYAPDPLTTLMYLATAILRVSNLKQTIEKKRARDRSLQEPVFGLEERKEGVLMGLLGHVSRLKIEVVDSSNGSDGVVVEMEARRKSGRAVRETFVLSTSSSQVTNDQGIPRGELGGRLSLLDDHPLYASLLLLFPTAAGGAGDGDGGAGEGEVETTFNLGLTEKQRRDREGVVLPYFDAQRVEGVGEGGRILYEMDRVDDFDEEEDEI